MRRWIAGLIAIACLVTGCTSTVDGSGHLAGSSPRSSGTGPDFTGAPTSPDPSSTSGPTTGSTSGPTTGSTTGPTTGPAATLTCPSITYPQAHLSFSCIDPGLVADSSDPVWPLNLVKPVEATWAMSQGAGSWGPAKGQGLEAIAVNVRTQMLKEDPPAYGTSPTVTTTSSKAATVAGAKAWVLATTFTLNPAFRKERTLTVKVEKSWIVAIQSGSDNVSLWYVTIPDDVSPLWAKVPAAMATIKII